MTATVRPSPCASCPYRRSVPSGVWDAAEYAKLPGYDGPTWGQRTAVFCCHLGDGLLCAGWVGHRDPFDLLALRLAAARGQIDRAVLDYTTSVPLFRSGAEAAAHGLADVAAPSPRAAAVAAKILRTRELPAPDHLDEREDHPDPRRD